MQYALLIYEDETFWQSTPPEKMGEIMAGYQRFGEEGGERIKGGEALQPTATATTVRVRDGERMLTDGPYAETKDQIAGFDIIECADLDEAIDVASKHPMAWAGMIELRPFWPDDQD
jgi:hypothetical protein